MSVKESFKHADQILCDATKSISELITINGTINLDFRDIETTMRGGGGAIMAIGRASGELRVEKAIIDALDSPLLYGNNISRAKRLLFNIYTSEKHPLLVKEMKEVDSFMDALNPNIEVINGISDDNSLDADAKVTILATGFDDDFETEKVPKDAIGSDEYFNNLVAKLYKPYKKKSWSINTDAFKDEEPASSNAKKENETKTEMPPLHIITENPENDKQDDIHESHESPQRPHHTPSFLDRAKNILEKQITSLMQD